MSKHHTSGRSSVRTILTIVALAVFVPIVPVGGWENTRHATAQSEQVRPFDMPSTAALQASPKKVYAHYFTPYPISIDNRDPSADFWARNYLSIEGENRKWAANGGLLRDRPFPRAVNPSADWFVEDMRTEVRNASSAGIDGFTVDMLGLTGMHWDRLNALLTAAAQVDPNFDIVLMPDSMTSVVADPRVLADKIASIASHPSVARLADGRLVVAPFAPERVGVEFWKTFISRMRTSWGIEVALVPTFVVYGSNVAAFAPISYMLSSFGARNPQANRSVALSGTDAHARGLPWMQPVSLQDNRPKSGVFDEAHNSETLRTTWEAAIDLDAEWVNIVTWNDYGEHTHFAPSVNTGWSPLDISSYYLTWFKTGAPPPIVRDAAYVSHRIQFAAAQPSSGHSIRMKPRALSTAPRDAVEVLTFLAAPAGITATVGGQVTSWIAPAGIDVRTMPLQVGPISVQINHANGGATLVDAPQPVVNPPYVQDLQYRFVSSLREGRRVESSAGAPAPVVTNAPAPVVTAPPTTAPPAPPTTARPASATTAPPAPPPAPQTTAPPAPATTPPATTAPPVPAATVPVAPVFVASWDFDEGAGFVAGDGTGNSDGRLIGGPTWTDRGTGHALRISGRDGEHVRVPASPKIDAPAGAISVGAWVRPVSVSAEPYLSIASRQFGTSYRDQWTLHLRNGRPAFAVTTSSGTATVVAPGSAAVGDWLHLAGTYDGARVRLYLNGIEVASRAFTGALVASDADLLIGANQNDNSVDGAQEQFRGTIDDVWLSATALTTGQIVAMAQNSVIITQPELTCEPPASMLSRGAAAAMGPATAAVAPGLGAGIGAGLGAGLDPTESDERTLTMLVPLLLALVGVAAGVVIGRGLRRSPVAPDGR